MYAQEQVTRCGFSSKVERWCHIPDVSVRFRQAAPTPPSFNWIGHGFPKPKIRGSNPRGGTNVSRKWSILMDIPSAKIQIRMAYICSNCERALRLRVAEHLPSTCPYCGVVFQNGMYGTGSLETNVEESITRLKTARSSKG